MAYSVESDQYEDADGIRLDLNLATSCVWGNNDTNIETVDGKETLHTIMGHTYQNIMEDYEVSPYQRDFRERKNVTSLLEVKWI